MSNQSDQSKEDWKAKLTEKQYKILIEKGTDPAGSGQYYHFDEKGNYHCAACGNLLFTSETKYHSGSGWPSFYDFADSNSVHLHRDNSLGMIRTEITCANCGGHLGHVFEDGPNPTGQRYCVNSTSLDFKSDSNVNEK